MILSMLFDYSFHSASLDATPGIPNLAAPS